MFCSQMQSLADHGPYNNIFYPHGPPLLVSRDSHCKVCKHYSMVIMLIKGTNYYTQLPAQPNRMGNRFGTYPGVTSDEDISSEELTHRTQVD